MHLYPSSSSLSNTTFRNKDGQIIYKIESSTRWLSRQITIKRIVPSNNTNFGKGSNNALRASFTDLAEIYYECLSSRIRYNGTEMATSDFFRKSGFMGRDRVFTGPDGKEYEWKPRSGTCNLYLKSVPKSLIASYHSRSFGIIGDAHPSSLEIFEEGEHMVDIVFVTFIFIEKQRKNADAAAGAAAGAAASG